VNHIHWLLLHYRSNFRYFFDPTEQCILYSVIIIVLSPINRKFFQLKYVFYTSWEQHNCFWWKFHCLSVEGKIDKLLFTFWQPANSRYFLPYRFLCDIRWENLLHFTKREIPLMEMILGANNMSTVTIFRILKFNQMDIYFLSIESICHLP
jgi:hypothetical protein